MPRAEFSLATKIAAYERADGICECGCGQPFGEHPKERPEYHHRVEAALGGGNDLENCRCVRVDCHLKITASVSAPRVAKVRREKKRRKGWSAKKRLIPGSKGTGIRKPINGPAYRVKE